MKQPEDTRTMELAGLDPIETGNGGGRMQSLAELLAARDQLAEKIKRSKPRGAYRGAVKIGANGHALRAKTGKSQAEFAKLAGVSERSLRTWEGARDPAREAPKVHAAIVAALTSLGVTYGPPKARHVSYRHPLTGDTWSGRGLMPVWMRRSIEDNGYTLDQLRANPSPQT